MQLYKIEKGVKLPPPAKAVASVKVSKATATMTVLEKGDSFLVRDELEAVRAEKQMRGKNARERETSSGKSYTARRVKSGVRIWRVK